MRVGELAGLTGPLQRGGVRPWVVARPSRPRAGPASTPSAPSASRWLVRNVRSTRPSAVAAAHASRATWAVRSHCRPGPRATTRPRAWPTRLPATHRPAPRLVGVVRVVHGERGACREPAHEVLPHARRASAPPPPARRVRLDGHHAVEPRDVVVGGRRLAQALHARSSGSTSTSRRRPTGSTSTDGARDDVEELVSHQQTGHAVGRSVDQATRSSRLRRPLDHVDAQQEPAVGHQVGERCSAAPRARRRRRRPRTRRGRPSPGRRRGPRQPGDRLGEQRDVATTVRKCPAGPSARR